MRSQPLILACLLSMGMISLSSCSLLSPVKAENRSTYVLNTVPTHVVQKKTRPITLLVMQPETRPAFNTTQMAYTLRPYQVAYFSQNQWAETPSQMLQPLIVQTMQNTHLFHAVATPPFMGRYDYMLNTEITQLEQDFTRVPARVQMKVRVQIIRNATNQVVATKQFTASEPIRYKSPYSGVVAANRATSHILKEMASFCVGKITHTS